MFNWRSFYNDGKVSHIGSFASRALLKLTYQSSSFRRAANSSRHFTFYTGSGQSSFAGSLRHTLNFAFPPMPTLVCIFFIVSLQTRYFTCSHFTLLVLLYVLFYHVCTWGTDHLDNNLPFTRLHITCSRITGQVPSPCLYV